MFVLTAELCTQISVTPGVCVCLLQLIQRAITTAAAIDEKMERYVPCLPQQAPLIRIHV